MLVEVRHGGAAGGLNGILPFLFNGVAVLVAAITVRPLLPQVLSVGGGVGGGLAAVAGDRLGLGACGVATEFLV